MLAPKAMAKSRIVIGPTAVQDSSAERAKARSMTVALTSNMAVAMAPATRMATSTLGKMDQGEVTPDHPVPAKTSW